MLSGIKIENKTWEMNFGPYTFPMLPNAPTTAMAATRFLDKHTMVSLYLGRVGSKFAYAGGRGTASDTHTRFMANP
jgi:hypothetical protein